MRHLFYGISAIIFWGTSFLATKILIANHLSPMQISFLRLFIVWVAMLFIKDKDSKPIAKSDLKYFYVMGILGITFFYYFENTGLKYTTIANTSLITSIIPFFTLIYARIFLKKKLIWKNILGFPLGIMGTALLFYRDISAVHIKGDLLVFISVFFWIFYSFAYDKISGKYSQLQILKTIFGIGMLGVIPFLIFEYKSFAQINVNSDTFLALFYLSLICTLLAYLLWNNAIKNLGIKITSNLILFIPIISIIIGILFWNEPFSYNLIWSAILILTGSYLTSQNRKNSNF